MALFLYNFLKKFLDTYPVFTDNAILREVIPFQDSGLRKSVILSRTALPHLPHTPSTIESILPLT